MRPFAHLRRRPALLPPALLLLLLAAGGGPPAARAFQAPSSDSPGGQAALDPRPSHRLIVELASPPLAEWAHGRGRAANVAAGLTDQAGALDLASPLARVHLARLEGEQRRFVKLLGQALPRARVATFIDEHGRAQEHRYAITFNGLTVDAGRRADLGALRGQLLRLPGVRRVYADLPNQPAMYASLPLINAAAVWDHPHVGGAASAGAGIRFASMDGGVHHAAPMFDGAGYRYPAGYPKGYAANTNGKIIASRAYFRPFDPPAAGDEKPWPGVAGTEHGVHTASTAAGNAVKATFWGTPLDLSGVAPRAYVMSYRVFYASVQGDGSFHNAEGLAALEDIVADGAQVVNNSWGGGPSSRGGEGDALDTALVNASRAGVFVSMSAGNSGFGLGTVDHPSGDYISVAASSTTGLYASGRLGADAPEPVPEALTNMAFAVPSWGALLPVGRNRYTYRSAASVDPANANGCAEFPPQAFDDQLALISRGVCEFGLKALNAQKAGATFVIIHNHAAGGNDPMGMGEGAFGAQVTIPAIAIGHANGQALVDWHAQHGAAASLSMDTSGYFVGNTPDKLADFSSRGPAAGLVLKPDISAPGVNIMAQGYDGSVRGEARHLGFGQAGGTSMASPHVAGAAIMLRQIHPDWDNAAIKSALMSTSKFRDIYTHDGRPAQPLDMGAGRLDLTRAASPVLLLDPPSLSFGQVMTGTAKTLTLKVTNVSRQVEMISVSTVDTSRGFTRTMAVAGLTANRRSVTLVPGESRTLDFTWDAARAGGYGDRQGYVLLQAVGQNQELHLPAWMRVGYPRPEAKVLVIDNDGSSLPPESLDAIQPGLRFKDYAPVYSQALTALGVAHQTYDADAQRDATGARLTTLPDAAWLAAFDTILYQTGDNSLSDASNLVSGTTAPTIQDGNRLVEYLNGGGRLIAFGQDLAATFAATVPDSAPFLYDEAIGAEWLSDSVTGGVVYTRTRQLVVGAPGTPFGGLSLDLSATGDGEGNQASVDEIDPKDGRTGILMFGGSPADLVGDGYVATASRDEPSLERPRTTFAGRTLYFSFGLEGVTAMAGQSGRGDLLRRALDWSADEAAVVITPTLATAQEVTYFELAMASTRGGGAVGYRMDFGDGSELSPVGDEPTFGHVYDRPGRYTARAEAVNALGTTALAELEIYVPPGAGLEAGSIFLPSLER